MKALTLTQPWATLVAVGEKCIETRGKRTHHRGPLAIHAGSNLAPVGGLRGLEAKFEEHPFGMVLHRHGYEHAADLPRGFVVATCEVISCFPTSTPVREAGEMLDSFAPYEVEFGDYSEGRWCWGLANVQRLEEPIPARGHQWLWDLDDDLLPT